MGQRGVDVARFGGDLKLLVAGHGAQGTHIVQAVGHLDEHHSHVFHQGTDDLLEILRLRAFDVVGVVAAVQFGEAVHDLGHPLTKLLVDVFQRYRGIFNYVVQQGAHNSGRPQADLFGTDAGHLDGVGKVGLARLAALVAVSVSAQLVGALQQVAVRPVQVGQFAEQVLVHFLDEGVIGSPLFGTDFGERGHVCRFSERVRTTGR